jgi:hypothetical protein
MTDDSGVSKVLVGTTFMIIKKKKKERKIVVVIYEDPSVMQCYTMGMGVSKIEPLLYINVFRHCTLVALDFFNDQGKKK